LGRLIISFESFGATLQRISETFEPTSSSSYNPDLLRLVRVTKDLESDASRRVDQFVRLANKKPPRLTRRGGTL